MALDIFFGYKNRIMEALVTNEKIVSLINDDIDFRDAKQLIYKQIFPYEYIPETVEFGNTFICVDVDIQKVSNDLIMLPTIYVWVFTHKSQLRLPEGGVRTDELVSEIDSVLNGSRLFGIGELDLSSCRRFAPITDYQGKVLRFDAKEINHSPDAKHRVPANRKNPGRFYESIIQ